MDRDTFLDVLRQSRLLSDQQVAAVANEFSGREASQAIATSLISRGWLTPFQARRLAEGQGAGLVLGQYHLLEEAGQGGFGRVYKALHAVMGRVVAVKVISPEAAEEAQARSWFKREVRAATQLYHPNIVMAYDANEAEGLLFLVMEYVDGSDLETLVKCQGPLPVGLACEMMRQAARALQYAHEREMVHRDIKPANLLIPRGPGAPAAGSPPAGPPVVVKVVDFGLARLHRSPGANTLPSQTEKRFLGTPDYVSPEQVRDASAVDIRSDLYSLGCTFYYALIGRKPFRGETVFETVLKHLEEEAQPVRAIRPEIPATVSAIVGRLMAKDPAKRFQTPAELIGELDFLCGPAGGVFVPEPVGVGAIATGVAEAPSEKVQAGATRFLPALAFDGSSPDRKGTLRTPDPVPTGRNWSECPSPGAAFTRFDSVAEEPAAPDRTPFLEEEDEGSAPGPQARSASDGTQAPSASDGTGTHGDVAADSAAGGGSESPSAGLPPRSGALWALWQQWVGVVEIFARGGGRRINEGAYRELHRDLLEACRSQAAAEGEPEEVRRLESLVEPWLEPQTFATADRAALAGLLPRCRQVAREVFGADPENLKEKLGLLNLLIAFVLAAVVGAVALYWRAGQVGPFPAKLTLAAFRGLLETYPILSLGLVASVVLFFSVAAVSRLHRT